MISTTDVDRQKKQYTIYCRKGTSERPKKIYTYEWVSKNLGQPRQQKTCQTKAPLSGQSHLTQ